jgi:hypothetical protein
LNVPFGSLFILLNPGSGNMVTAGSSIGPSGIDSTDLHLSSSEGNTFIEQLLQNQV